MEQSIKSVLVKQTLTQQQQFASMQVTHAHTRTRAHAHARLTCSASLARLGCLPDGVSDHGLWRCAVPPAVSE